MPKEDLEYLLQLSLVPGLGPTLTRRCIEHFGSAEATLQAAPEQLAAIDGIGKNRAGTIRRNIDKLQDGKALANEKQLIAEHNITLLPLDHPKYPRLLKHIPDPPPMIYVKGKIKPSDVVALAIVGARKCTNYGREQADRMASLCAQAGLCIVSGGAVGIDAAAHRAAINNRGRTIAVIGSGIARPYPADHADLFDQIAARHGAVVSEFPMTVNAASKNFPRRNRIISGLAMGVLVIEAALRSGTHITARLAAEEHNREVMALPGRVDSPMSAGCHKIIREGWAALVTSAADVLETLSQSAQLLRAGIEEELGDLSLPTRDAPTNLAPLPKTMANLTPTQRKILETLAEPMLFDELVHHADLPVSIIQSDLTMLEILGLVTRSQGKLQRRNNP